MGVEGALRVPDLLRNGARRVRAWYLAQPLVSQVFVALAAVDLLARGIGVIGPALILDLSSPLSVLASLVPRTVLILLPAIIVMRRPAAEGEMPSLVDGSIFVAFVELLSHPTTTLLNQLGGIVPWAAASMVAIAVQFVGWVLIGRGLASLNPPRVSENVAGWANLAVLGIVAGVALTLATFLAGPGVDVGDPELNGVIALNTVALILAPIALAFAYRSAIRGLDDERRPEPALRLAAAAGLLAAGLGLAGVALSLLVAGGLPVARSIAETVAWGWLTWLGAAGGTSLLVLAFALGLADPQGRGADEAVTLGRP